MSTKVFPNREPLETGVEDEIEWQIYFHTPTGSTNGYARIPEGHPWRKLDDFQWGNSANISIHGGVTFGITDDGWIGFDTSHYGDYWPDSPMNFGHSIGDTDWTREMVVAEAKDLARQIAKGR